MEFPQVSSSFIGRLAKIKCPKTRPLLPLFEAISNSVDSFELSNVGSKITIDILRDESQGTLTDDRVGDILGFKITDDGVGFTDINFKSFCELDSTYKKDIGGKGVGHLTWLKAFDHVEITSTFTDNNATYTRSMILQEDTQPFKHYSLIEDTKSIQITTVTLSGYKNEFKAHLNKTIEIIADKILCHFMPRMFAQDAIDITIFDGINSITLRDYYESNYTDTMTLYDFNISGFKFDVNLLPTSSARDNKNKVYYCANKRTVESDGVEVFCKYIPASGKYIAAYVSGEFLDRNVSDHRLGFDIYETKKDMLDAPIGWDDIKREVKSIFDTHSKPMIASAYSEHKNKIDSYVQNHNPRYRTLLANNPNIIDKIPFNPGNDDIVAVLEVENQRNRVATKEKIAKVLDEQSFSLAEKKSQMLDVVKKNYQSSKDILADYMLERRVVLDLLKSLMAKQSNGEICLEEDVHSLVFPMGSTSDSIDYDEHNLWIIDERLSFHRLLTSDLSISSNFDKKSRKEPDILCYIDDPVNTHNNFSSAIIVEFKRPLKPGKHKDPIEQVKETALELKDGNVKINERKIKFKDNAHFYGYIITDFDTTLLRKIKLESALTRTYDGDGFFGYYKELNLYLEIISFDKLLNDAEKRNQILFHKLGIIP